jgi:hypothetical protein
MRNIHAVIRVSLIQLEYAAGSITGFAGATFTFKTDFFNSA